MKSKRKILALFLLVLAVVLPQSLYPANNMTNLSKEEKTQLSEPDFAYPKTVAKNAEAILKKARKSNDGSTTIQAAVQLTLAQLKIDTDSVNLVANRVENLIKDEKNTATRAILDIVAAQVYDDIYKADRWKYDRRELPDEPIPDRVEEWGKQHFRAKILSHIDAALAAKNALAKVPITEYKGAIDITEKSVPYYPSLFDFVAFKSIDMLKSLSEVTPVFSTNWLCRWTLYAQMKFNYTDPIAARILRIYQDLDDINKGNLAAFIIDEMERIDFVSDHVYDPSDDNDSEEAVTDDDLLVELFEKYKASDYSTEILINIAIKYDVEYLQKFVEEHKSYWRIDAIRNIIGLRLSQSLSVYSNDIVAPGDSLDVNVSLSNLNEYYVSLYRLDIPESERSLSRVSSSYYRMEKGDKKPQLVKTWKFTQDGKAPFSKSVVQKIRIDEPGYYALVPHTKSTPKIDFEKQSVDIIRCTGLHLGNENDSKTFLGFVVNPLTGAPVMNATLKQKYYDSDARIYKLENETASDKNGRFSFERTVDRYTVFPILGKDKYARSLEMLSKSRESSSRERIIFDVNTDLSIYHLGDSVQFSVVAQRRIDHNVELLANEEFEVVLRDANYQERGSLKLTTDEWGRAKGAFLLPSDGLTGRYTISAGDSGNAYIMVSDYKLPTFIVETDRPLMDTPTKGSVTVKGRAVTYSGFAVADADVTANLAVGPRWSWYSRKYVDFQSTKVKTDADGRFTLEYPAEMLEQAPIPKGFFRTMITVTSSAGESHQTSATFMQGNAYSLSVSMSSNIRNDAPVKVKAVVKENGEKEIPARITYTVKKKSEKEVLLSGEFASGETTIDLTKLESGNYTIEFAAPDLEGAPKTSKSLLLYRLTDAKAPNENLIWVEKSSLTADADRKASMVYATSLDKTFIYVVTYDDKAVVNRELLEVGPGFHTYDVKVPTVKNRLTVKMITVGNYKSDSEAASVTTADYYDDSISIDAESFRDKITPGAEETWKFTVKDKTGKGKSAGVILDMYTKALEQLQSHSISIASPYWSMFYTDQRFSSFGRISEYALDIPSFVKTGIPTFGEPELNLFGEDSFYDRYSYDMLGASRGRVLMKSADAAPTGGAVLYEKVEESVAAAPEAEPVVAYGKVAEKNDSGEAPAEENFEYRDAETPLAFFCPMLNTDAEGNLSFSFTAPNQNTTWLLHALAYTPELKTSKITREIVANKPIMVKPNPPRFLRQGDRAQILATVMNNSEEAQAITTTIEVFDPMTGKVIKTHKQTDQVAANGSAIAALEVEAPFDATSLGYRAKSSIAGYADGEQSLLPILSSVTPVIESTTFYLAPDSTYYKKELPKMPADARVTMQFCENPAWYCVTALPGIRKEVDRTTSSAAASIFSAAIADGILRENPNIATVIQQWKESEQTDSTLTSMLEKNQDLKIVLLNATPWVMDARSQTERMQRLCLLLDRKEIDTAYTYGIERLSKLQRHGGGWAWIDECDEASYWSTLNALALFGRLRELGYLPGNVKLNEMIKNAIVFIDADVAKDFKLYPKSVYPNYVLTRDYYKDLVKLPSANQKVYNATISWIASRWRKDDVANKAIDAIILNNNDHSSTAREILNSLREYAVSTPQYGMWWPSDDKYTGWSIAKISSASIALDAFHAIEPNCKEIDQIRQWLVLQREAKDWGTSVTTADVVASILTSGRNWLKPSGATYSIKVGKGEILPDHTEAGTGYFRRNINDMIIPGVANELAIERHANHPSWGSVICQYRGEMSEIKAVASDAVEVEKRFFVEQSTEKGKKWIETTDIKVGDRVKIHLRIRNNRDMDYVAIIDDRAACFEPVEQLPRPIYSEGICFYRENRDSATNIYVTHMPKGTYLLEYEMFVNNAGTFSSGVATLQCQQAPQLTAHSAGAILKAAAK